MDPIRRQRPTTPWEEIEQVSSRMDAQLRRGDQAEALELREAEEQSVTLISRLRANNVVRLRLTGAEELTELRLKVVGEAWLLGTTGRSAVLINTDAIETVHGLPRQSDSAPAALSPTVVLRRWRGSAVVVETNSTSHRGKILAVGRDWLDLATAGGTVTVAIANARRVDAPLS